ncbi:MAG: cell division ATPase MinD [Candidatus Aenigmarchaeota archaeon]|nr:cell division ATPase MinD [Candidatus Aenigmarchaeota archaeon]
MTRIICIASGKGGVGKTTLVANLTAALAQFNRSVVAVDGNTTTSNLGIHFGIPLYPVTLQDVMRKKASLRRAIYHHPAGFRIIPADVSLRKLMLPDTDAFMDVLYRFVGDADFVLIDSAAGLGKEAKVALESADEVLTVTNPDMPSLTDAVKITKVASRYETRNLGVIVNRVRGEKHEVSLDGIERFMKLPVVGRVPEDRHVRAAIASRQPVVLYNPYSPAARNIMAIAAWLAGEDYAAKTGLLERLGRLLGRPG